MYKDVEKQRKAVREAVRRWRAKHKGITAPAVHVHHNVIPCNTPEPQPNDGRLRAAEGVKNASNHANT